MSLMVYDFTQGWKFKFREIFNYNHPYFKFNQILIELVIINQKSFDTNYFEY